ncbi:MAG: response regulator [Proteobacteria bacterium]|nr:response regulator [Pseudomonadota bacterium]MBU1737964.1 response regulator [Pseudomonadota bacterium]
MRILVVDDNHDDRTLLRHIVEKNGHTAIEARDGREGLRMAEINRPDLIISDALMPIMDGFMFLKKIKEDPALSTIPFIFYSANYQANQDVELAESMGACSYIFKPKDPKELWGEIERTATTCRDKAKTPPGTLKEDQMKYLEKYRDILATKLEQKVAELEMALQQRNQAQKQLTKQHEFLQRALDALTHPFLIINVHDHSIDLVNEAARSWEYRPEIKCYELIYNRTAPCTGLAHPCPIDTIRETKKSVVFEHRHQYANGDQKFFEVHGYPVFGNDQEVRQIIEYCIDITDRKKEDEERRRLTTLIEQTADSIIITDRNATIQYVNPSFERITGYSRDEAVGKTPRILKSGSQSTDFYRKMWATLKSGQVWRGELTNRKKDGTLFVEEASITPVHNNAGKITTYVAIKRDVTEQKQLEKHLQQAQKMEAIGTLAGGIAHDFNNILTAILGYTRLVLDELPKQSELYSFQEQVLHAGNRAKDLVNQILTFSRQKAQEPKPVKFHLIVKEALKLLHSSIPSNINIRSSIDPEVGMVMADPTQLHQIVMNLCTNAYHAMRETGGDLTISLRSCSPDETDRIFPEIPLPPAQYINLEVSDTGHGMDRETLEKIFEPYFTTKIMGEGTGLGLAIVHSIVKSCNGHIGVSSKVNIGTTFNVYLPRIENHTSDPETIANGEYPGGSERILLVDDDGAIAALEHRMLTGLGYQAESYTDCSELLGKFMASPESVDLIISDMTMPEMTGVEICKKLRDIRPDIPIILCTGFNEQIDEKKALDLGFDAFLMKPVATIKLATAVRNVLDKRSAGG